MPTVGRMTAITSTAYSRDLGDELRRLREKHTRLTGFAFAEQLGWDPSKVSNIENGKARASEIDLVQYLMTCGRDSNYFEAFRDRYRYAFDPYVVLGCSHTREAPSRAAGSSSSGWMPSHWMRDNHGACWRATSAASERTPMSHKRSQDALVRDSKATGSDALVFSIQAWRAFVASVA
ncbi:hypothetical protein GCM10022267_48550 [Lentzea roselyniae]|uniref:HTH cro/C1-type domain-containing protein n=2 Tax=Lentzea roselyniae TaxID=531940 RepID=A0ABP7BE55_9PSEU